MTKNKYMNKKILIILTILLLLIPATVAINYPHLTGYLTDNANIIDSEYEQKITDLADRINKATTVEIAVLTIPSLEGDSPENYAVNTFRQNGVGKKDNNNGLLILVAKDERKYRFEVGYGLEGTIPDAMKVNIGDKIIVPNFKNGDYGKGVYESMLVVEGLVTNNTEVLSKYGMIQNSRGGSGGDRGSGLFILMILVVIGIFGIIFVLKIRESIRGMGTYSSPPPVPATYIPPPYTRSSGSGSSKSTSSGSSSSTRRSSSYGGSSHSHSIGHGFGGGFGGGRSGGGGFGGSW